MTLKDGLCPAYRTNSGAIKYGSAACQRQRDSDKISCEECKFIDRAPKPAPPTPQAEKKGKTMNTMTDLHNELFIQLKRLNDKELKGEDLKAEIERSRAVAGVCNAIISNAGLVLKAHLGVANSVGSVQMPGLIAGGDLEGEDAETI